jgi:cephalosporin-C deacetylase-like acetyl esterase
MLLLALFACTPPPADETGDPVADDGCTHPDWDGALPFPSNRLVTRDDTSPTGVRLAIDPAFAPITKGDLPSFDTTQLDGQDGFSRVAPAVVGFHGALDPAAFGVTADADAPVFLLDVDAEEVVPGRLDVTDDGTTLVVWPDRALRPAAPHAIVIRSDLPAPECFSAGPGLTAAAGDDADDPTLAAEMATARDAAVAAGLAETDIAATIPFTTRSAEGEAVTMNALAAAAPALVDATDLSFDTVVDCATGTLDGYCTDGVAFAALGTAVLPSWQGADGAFVVDGDGVPAPQGTEPVAFWLLVPEAGRTTPAPLVVLQHGLGGDKESLLGIGQALAGGGRAVVAIDAVAHGDRPHDGDVTMAFFGIDFTVWAIGRGRDNIRQTAADHLALRTLLADAGGADHHFASADGASFYVDADDAAYLGQSLGGIIGANTCALDTGLDRCVLNVPGGRLVEVVRANPAYSALMNLYFDKYQQQQDVELFSALAQTLVDTGDPAVVAPRILAAAPARSVLVQEATDDGTVANQTTEVMARSMGIPLLEPAIEAITGMEQAAMPVDGNFSGAGDSLVTAGLAQFADGHGFLTTGDAEATRAFFQITTFLDDGRIVDGE